MFEAQYLFGGNAVFSPWMSRGGDNIIITADVIEQDTSNLTITLFEKNSETVGDGSAHAGGSLSATAVGRADKEYTGVLEIVRYKLEATGSGTNRIMFRMLSPVWFDDVTA